MRIARAAVRLAAGVAVAVVGFGIMAFHATLPPQPLPASFDTPLVERGARLAALGNCNVCHAAPGGKAFAGGLGIATPFGTIHASNITPDPETGIGAWSLAAFIRAMRQGVDRSGHLLYPVFPYDHFSRVTDEDDAALYAYLMTRDPVSAKTPANRLPFPLNVRVTLTVWNLLYLRQGVRPDDPAKSPAWNRGAYLVEGLGHCGACHTPRNALGAEQGGQKFAGAGIDGWYATAIDAASPAPVPWTIDSLAFYFKHGWQSHHGVARGPMAAVAANLAALPDDDLAAMATYLVDLMGPPSAAHLQRAAALLDGHSPVSADRSPGATIYAGVCAGCHQSGRPLPFGGLPLGFSSTLTGDSPANVMHIVVDGLPATAGEAAPIMPGFRGAFTEPQLAELLSYLRARFTDKPAWNDLDGSLRAVMGPAVDNVGVSPQTVASQGKP